MPQKQTNKKNNLFADSFFAVFISNCLIIEMIRKETKKKKNLIIEIKSKSVKNVFHVSAWTEPIYIKILSLGLRIRLELNQDPIETKDYKNFKENPKIIKNSVLV